MKASPLLIAVVVGWMFFSGVHEMLHADPYFQVARVTVFPTGVLSNAEYRFLEDSTRGQSLIEVDLRRVSDVLERNPKAKRAEVSRVFPHQLSVVLTPRLPLVQVQFRGKGPYVLVARDQVMIAKQMTPVPELIILEDFATAKPSQSVGRMYQNKYFPILPDVLAFIAEDLLLEGETVRRVAIDALGNWTLILNDGLELIIGKELRLADEQRVVLKTLLRSSERADLTYVDARYPDVVVKRK